MRTPADIPRRPGGGIGSRGRVGLVVLAVALFVLLTSLRGIAGFWTDFLWFDSLGFSSVFTGILGARVLLGALFTGIFFVLLWVSLLIADRLAPGFRPLGPEEEIVERYNELVGHRQGLVRVVVAALFAVIAGVGVASQWNLWLLFTNAQDFGTKDPQFGLDIGFFVFRLPFLVFLVDWVFASLVIITLITAVAHYLNGGIRVQGAAQRVTPQVKAHLSVLLAAMALSRALSYFLARYELNFSTRGVVQGATYTDVNAQLPALWLLVFISLAAVVLFILNIWRRGWVLPVLAAGLWAFVAVAVGGAYPAFVQRFQVEPNESSRERPYIEHNIEATRKAMGLDAVETTPFAANTELDGPDLVENEPTVRNIRLWDPQVAIRSFQQLQAIRPFYSIPDVNVDRYMIDGELTQVLVSSRELNTEDVPQDSWEARQLAFTHGYGAVMAPANAKTEGGNPNFILRDVPLSGPDDLEIEKPGIYVGNGLDGYAIVQTNTAEIDFQNDVETVQTDYDGDDGVAIGSYVRRAAFALRYGDLNPLISNNLRPDSRILYNRDVRQRLESVAPFLRFDSGSYPVIADGRLSYVVDAYTTSNRYPYAEEFRDQVQLKTGSGLRRPFNYVRNSVKAVVDAYDGTVTLYVIDDEDPIVAAYRQAFPDLFVDGDTVPAELEAHFRYPEDLFTAQTSVWGRYHIENPNDFYNGNDAWDVAADPGTAGASASTQTIDEQGRPVGNARAARIDPSYILTRLPNEEKEEFIVLRPFVPVSGSGGQRLLTSFLVAKGDPENYGKLENFVMPPTSLPSGPGVVAAAMRADEVVSGLELDLGSAGSSEVLYGNLVVYPIEESLLYVRPMYVQPGGSQIPELRKVIVFFDDKVEVADTLEEALVAIFGESPATQEVDGSGEGEGEGEAPAEGEGEAEPELPDDVVDLLEQANEQFEAAQTAIDDGDLGEYQERNAEAQELIQRALALGREEADAETPPTTAAEDAGTS